jgi:hypothetical protein
MAVVVAALLPVFLHLEGLFRPSLAASVAVFLKLVQMPVLAQIITLQTILAALTMPIAIALVA